MENPEDVDPTFQWFWLLVCSPSTKRKAKARKRIPWTDQKSSPTLEIFLVLTKKYPVYGIFLFPKSSFLGIVKLFISRECW